MFKRLMLSIMVLLCVVLADDNYDEVDDWIVVKESYRVRCTVDVLCPACDFGVVDETWICDECNFDYYYE